MLSKSQIKEIKAEVKHAATTHLNTKDLASALRHYTDDVVAVSNNRLFSSFESLSSDIEEYYKILRKVNYATWEGVHIQVINESAATFTAKFSYGFTTMDGDKIDLKGVWTALYILDEGIWKIRLRHESFEQAL